jgi:GAF domain-containing protein
MAKFYDEGFDPDDLSIKVSELLVATADGSDELIDSAVTEVLSLLRQRLAMDVVFVSEFVDGERVFRYVESNGNSQSPPEGASDPLEETWCQRVVDGRMPEHIPDISQYAGRDEIPAVAFPVNTYLSTPILLQGGKVYGTLCCYSASANNAIQQRDLRNLRSVAQLVARKVDRPTSGT